MTAIIRSIQNPRIKQAVRLRDRRGRRCQSRIIVDGLRETRRAIEAGIAPAEVFVCESLLEREPYRELSDLLSAHGCELVTVTRDVFRKLAFGNRSDGVVLVAPQPERRLEELELPGDALVCVLETVEKPGNLGAIVRTADAAGVAAVIVADPRTDLFNPNAIRASLGAIFRVPVCTAESVGLLAWLRGRHFTVYTAHVGATRHYAKVDYRGRAAIVLGSESLGLSDAWQGDLATPIGVPMMGMVDSLNVSATAAVLFYEALRQRQG